MSNIIYHPRIQHGTEQSYGQSCYGVRIGFLRLLIYFCLIIAAILFLHGNRHSARATYWAALPDSEDRSERYILGDLVWQDEDQDGYQDPDEQGVADITVALFNDRFCTGTLVGSTKTNVAGLYSFASLAPGEYCLRFSSIPLNWGMSIPDRMTNERAHDDGADSDGVIIDDKTLAYIPNIVLTTDNLDQDLGLYPQTVEIGDRVWLDTNGNNQQESEEVGIPNISVHLLSPDGMTHYGEQVTDENGYYLFRDLSPGDYKVQLGLTTLPSNHVATDSIIQTGFLTSGTENLNADIGVYMPVTVNGIVWLDEDGNGLQDQEEPKVAAIAVALFNAQDELIGQTHTQNDGSYSFTGLQPDEYYVVFDIDTFPREHIPTVSDIGLDDARDSDVLEQAMPGQTEQTPLLSSDAVWAFDMGIVSLVAAGGRVWLDQNVNGIQDTDEGGIAQIGVTLLHEDGQPVYLGDDLAQTQTDFDGIYIFHSIRPGNYYVVFDLDTLPASHVVTIPNMGSDEESDSDVNPSTGRTSILYLISSAATTQHVDMGVYPLSGVRVGGIVWHDTNANGVQNVGEAGLSNVGVELFNTSDQALSWTSTDENGNYLFDDLKPGSYYARFDLATLPADHHVTVSVPDHHNQIHSDVDPDEGYIQPTGILADGMEEMDLSMGTYAFSSIGDQVWEDRNANGLQDPDEPGVADVQVNLWGEDGNHIYDTTTTDALGRFEFTHIMPGRYQLEFLVDDVFTITRQNAGNDDAIDSDAHPGTGWTIATNLISGENAPIWDLGIYKSASLGDRVWMDGDGNGIQNQGEAGIAGVAVYLTDIQGTSFLSVTSDAQGFYLFEEVPPGEYQLRCEPPEGLVYTISKSSNFLEVQPDGIDTDSLTQGDTLEDIFILSPGTRDMDRDIRLTSPASISSLVWVDSNGDGSRDDSESGIANMVVNLYNAEGVLTQVTKTSIIGAYEFVDLTPGSYTLEFMPPAGFKFTAPPEPNGSGRIDSHVSPLTGRTQTVLLRPGIRVTNLAAGIREDRDDQGITAVDLVQLSAAVAEDGAVIIVWETAAEIDTAGFHLHRGTTDEKADAAQITVQLIVSQGQDGGRYIFRDTSALPHVAYKYWLWEIEVDGTVNEQGSVSVNIQSGIVAHATFLPLILK